MQSNFLRLNVNDFIRGVVTAIFAAVITVLYQVTQSAGFDVFTANWGMILSEMINVSITVFIAYLSKNLLSDSDGKVLGSIG